VTSNSKESVSVLEDVIKQLDAPSEAGESTLRVQLRFAKSITVANSINILFAKNGSPGLKPTGQQGQNNQNPQPQQPQKQTGTPQSDFGLEQEIKEEGYYPWLGGPPDNPRTSDGRSYASVVSDLVGRVRAVPDHRGNAVLLSANVHFFPQVLKLIEELDAPTAQVLIEARIVEVASNFMEQLGVRWSPDGSKVFTTDDYNNSLIVHGTVNYLKSFGGSTAANTPYTSASIPGQYGNSITKSLGSLSSGVLDSSVSMDFLIQFLKTTTSATVLASPQINIEDNETGKLFVGQQVPFIDNSVIQAQGGQNSSFTYKDVGVILEVTPHINNSGDVSLKVHAESSTLSGQTILNGAVIDTRNFKTDLEAKNGQTLVLGGIIQRQVADTLRKTPFFGDIPGLGWAFKKKDKSTKEVELMVFLRPRVVRTPEDAREMLHETQKKTPLINKFEEEFAPKTKEKGGKNPDHIPPSE
jgi:general secretion pathway protein D